MSRAYAIEFGNERVAEVTDRPGYLVSESGRVFSTFAGKTTELRTRAHPNGYALATLGSGCHRLVHRLVAQAFLPPPLPGQTDVRHLDGNKRHNHISNLAWGTRAENVADDDRLGVRKRGSARAHAKLTEDVVAIIKLALSRGSSASAIARHFSVTKATIDRIADGSRWTHVAAAPDDTPLPEFCRLSNRGNRNGQAVLSWPEARQIRDFIKLGWHTRDVAKIYGVANETVRRIASGRNWRDDSSIC